MSISMILIIIVLTVLIVGGMAGVFILLNKQEQKKRTLQILTGQAVQDDSASKKNSADKRRADLARKLHENESPKTKKAAVLADLLRQAGWGDTTPKEFWMMSIGLGIILFLLTKLTHQAMPIVLMSLVVGTFGIPRFVLKFRIGRRQKKFLEEFPDALESMVRLLKAGMPVGEAIAMVSREYTGPVGEEMSKVYDEQKIGISMAEACLHAAERMPITEMQMFATGISIQQQTGSSLSEILTNLARVIRARFRLKRKVQALSAEAKASAMIIGALPILVGAGLSLINPDYMYPLFYTLKGKFYLFGAIGWMCVGVLVMRQMINFKV
jgi:tight adherence protein B